MRHRLRTEKDEVAHCPPAARLDAVVNPEPSPTGGGAEDDAYTPEKFERSKERVAVQPDWQALAGELAEAVGVAGHAHLAHYDAVVVAAALARYHEATRPPRRAGR